MNNERVIETKDLPESLQRALSSLGYGRKDVTVEATDSTTLDCPSYGDGYRGSVTIVNIATGQKETITGSWCGPNPWQSGRQAQVDGMGDNRLVDLVPGQSAVIKSQQGGGRPVFARIEVHHETLTKLFPSGANESISDDERDALAIMRGYISSARKDYFDRAGLGQYGGSNAVIITLRDKGMVKVSKTGSVSITTKGKNAVGQYRYHG